MKYIFHFDFFFQIWYQWQSLCIAADMRISWISRTTLQWNFRKSVWNIISVSFPWLYFFFFFFAIGNCQTMLTDVIFVSLMIQIRSHQTEMIVVLQASPSFYLYIFPDFYPTVRDASCVLTVKWSVTPDLLFPWKRIY